MFFHMSRCAVAVASRLSIAVIAILVCSGITYAGAITIDEDGVNAIFTQENFGETPVSIRFNEPQTIVAPQFLVINTVADLQGLYSLVPNQGLTIVAFFVDVINECLQVEVLQDDGRYYGCAQKPGNYQVLNSSVAAKAPSKLLAHEIGHNLSLEHMDLGLMTVQLGWSNEELFVDQVDTILQSPLVQTDANGQRFLEVTPVAIVGTPEPATLFLLSGGLGAFLVIKRRTTPRSKA